MSATSSPLSLSTCWASKQAETASDILALLEQTGFASFELDYRIQQRHWPELVAGLKTLGAGISSLHNFAPHPSQFPPEMASGDLFNLAAWEKEERNQAIQYTARTLEQASELEAKAVVLHLGWVEGALDKEVIKEAARQGRMTPELEQNLALRAESSDRALDAVSFSLERLIKRAEPLGVSLGLENRYHPGQVPDLAECRLLLERFAGAPVGHWHDLGHSRVQGRAGLGECADWLMTFGDSLLGCHLHDSRDDQDHLLPGRGEENWLLVAGALWRAPLKVLELHPGPSGAEIARAGEVLAREFGQARREAERGGEIAP